MGKAPNHINNSGAGKKRRDIIHRWEGNPVLMVDDMPFPCLNVYNAGVVRFNDKYILLIRVEDMQGHSEFVIAEGSDGMHFTVADRPVMEPSTKKAFAPFEQNGIEDPRITYLDDTYYIVYTCHSKHGNRIGLAKTDDFKQIQRIALISEPDNKSGALFPQKINNNYARLDRPEEGANIWISYSADLIYWGNASVVLTRRGGFWDSAKVGTAAPPLRVYEGWLLIYYGVKRTSAGPLYRLGAALLDYEDPTKVLGRCDVPILSPREYYERVGDWGNVVFACGALIEMIDGKRLLRLYYGASTTSICLGTADVDEIIKHCMQ